MVVRCPLGEASDAGEDLVGGLDPVERLGIGVVVLDEVSDCALQLKNASMLAALDLTLSEQCEPALDLVQPRAVSGREVHVETRALCEPAPDHG